MLMLLYSKFRVGWKNSRQTKAQVELENFSQLKAPFVIS